MLEDFVACGLVENRYADDHSSSWALTDLGSNKLRAQHVLDICHPVPVFKVRPSLQWEEYETWELLELLEQSGWTCIVKRERKYGHNLPRQGRESLVHSACRRSCQPLVLVGAPSLLRTWIASSFWQDCQDIQGIDQRAGAHPKEAEEGVRC